MISDNKTITEQIRLKLKTATDWIIVIVAGVAIGEFFFKLGELLSHLSQR